MLRAPHYAEWSPTLRERDPPHTTFTPQAANLWALKEKLRNEPLERIGFDTKISSIDGSPLPVCRFARAHRSLPKAGRAERFRLRRDDQANLLRVIRAHLIRVCWPGVIVEMDYLAPANVHDLCAWPRNYRSKEEA